MGEIALFLMKMTIRLGIIMAAVFAFIVIFNIAYTAVFVALNLEIIADLGAMIQIWLPFDLDVIFAWLLTVATSFLIYRFALKAHAFLNAFIGHN